ncbi:MAG: cytosine deaminase [Geminicoccaceae bacterium]|nr:cytosine deaminase [Geminicoccaceae bacterium]
MPAPSMIANVSILPVHRDPSFGDGEGVFDVAIENGRIAMVEEAGKVCDMAFEGGRIDAGDGLLFPTFADMHTHLDKGHIWPRAANPDGSFAGALEAVRADREANWSAGDVEARMEFALRCAWAHGTSAVRTHLDSSPPQHRISFPVFAAMRERWAGRIELQGVALATPDRLEGREGEDVARVCAEHGGIMGGVPFDTASLRQEVERIFDLAMAHDLAIDLHVDETDDPAACALRHIARVAIERNYDKAITCGHCCSLAVQDESETLHTLDLVARAGISIVSLPMCNMYLQDRRAGRTPRWRGVTLINEMRARGIPVAIASDNTRDPFYAYGDLDMHEVLRLGIRIAHLDHPVEPAAALVTTAPASIMGLSPPHRIEVGAPADMVLFEGRTMSELVSRGEERRRVFRHGIEIDTRPPSYRQLDGLLAR